MKKTVPEKNKPQALKSLELYSDDIPKNINFGKSVSVDTETMGLSTTRDRLCLVQLCTAQGNCFFVKFDKKKYNAPNLKKLLENPKITKIFHFARFDVAALFHYIGAECNPIYCTKIASKLTRTFTNKHGLKDLCRSLIKVNISKEQQTSDWGAKELTQDQLYYAASDVLYLGELKKKLDALLKRENRLEIAKACFRFLPTRAKLDLYGWIEQDIFEHSS